jgi:hypothetical protein
MSVLKAAPLITALKDVNTELKILSTESLASNDAGFFLSTLESLNGTLEKAAVISRNTLERLRSNQYPPKPGAPIFPHMNISGSVRVIEYNWLHIRLNALLPHCRFQTPQYLTDTVIRLLDCFAADGNIIPRFEKAMMVIDEHCDIKSRNAFDQDNKGWKAISNALKGRVFPDDDQFSLGIALVSTESENPMCNVFIIGAEDAGAFFEMRSSGALYW